MMPLRRLLGLTAVCLHAAFAADAGARRIEAADILRVRQVADPQVSPDGLWVAYTVGSSDEQADRRLLQVWMVSWDGKQQIPLTRAASSSGSPRWSPDGRFLSFIAAGPNEAGRQIWLLDRRGGEALPVEGLAGDIDEYAWSADASRLAVVLRPVAPADAKPRPIVIDRYHFKNDEDGYLQAAPPRRIQIFDLTTGRIAPLTSAAAFEESDPAWSPDGRRIAFVSNRDPAQDRVDNTDVWLASLDPGAPLRQLTTDPGQDNGPLAWSPDGRQIAYRKGPPLEDWLYHFHEPAIVPAAGGASRFPARALDRDGNQPRFSEDGRHLEFLVTDTGWVYPARVAVRGGSEVERALVEPYFVRAHSRAAGRTAVLAAQDTSPFEIHALERGRLRRLTHHNDEWLSQVQLVPSDDVHFAGKDGVAVHGLLTRPVGYSPGTRYPLVLWIHGGPYGQDRHSFDFERQLFAAQGYAVLQVNYRGSSGRGVQFARTIRADWGNHDLGDLLAGVEHAIGLGIADAGRLLVGGWSQGGILTNFVIARDARFKAAIAGAGAGNQLGLYGADPYIIVYDREFQPPWVDTERWLRLSYPFFHADRIRTPTLYVGGEKDFNVPIIGSEQMYQALKSLGVPAQLVIYPGQHHSFSRPAFQRDLMQRYVDWYRRWLE